jgi:hypothetical protein
MKHRPIGTEMVIPDDAIINCAHSAGCRRISQTYPRVRDCFVSFVPRRQRARSDFGMLT